MPRAPASHKQGIVSLSHDKTLPPGDVKQITAGNQAIGHDPISPFLPNELVVSHQDESSTLSDETLVMENSLPHGKS